MLVLVSTLPRTCSTAENLTTSSFDRNLTFSRKCVCFVDTKVCETRFLTAGARRQPRPGRALSEFSHAGLTFLALHAACSALVAPALRVIAAAIPWPSSVVASGAAVAAGSWEVAAAAAWGVLVLSPMVHLLPFYAFWHCVCLGLAELTGYPDRFLYGEKDAGVVASPSMFRRRWLRSFSLRSASGGGSGAHTPVAIGVCMCVCVCGVGTSVVGLFPVAVRPWHALPVHLL